MYDKRITFFPFVYTTCLKYSHVRLPPLYQEKRRKTVNALCYRDLGKSLCTLEGTSTVENLWPSLCAARTNSTHVKENNRWETCFTAGTAWGNERSLVLRTNLSRRWSSLDRTHRRRRRMPPRTEHKSELLMTVFQANWTPAAHREKPQWRFGKLIFFFCYRLWKYETYFTLSVVVCGTTTLPVLLLSVPV